MTYLLERQFGGLMHRTPVTAIAHTRVLPQRVGNISSTSTVPTEPSFGNAVPFGIEKLLQASRELVAESLHIVLVVNVLADAAEATAKLIYRLCPRLPGLRHTLTTPDPRDACLMKQNVLQVAWLPRGIVSIKRLETMLPHSGLEPYRDPEPYRR